MALVAVVNREGKILVAPRDDTLGYDPGCYMMPGGDLDPEDGPRETAERELLYLAGIYETPGMVTIGMDDEVILFACAYAGKHHRGDPKNLGEWEWWHPVALVVNESRHNIGVHAQTLKALDLLDNNMSMLTILALRAEAIYQSKSST